MGPSDTCVKWLSQGQYLALEVGVVAASGYPRCGRVCPWPSLFIRVGCPVGLQHLSPDQDPALVLIGSHWFQTDLGLCPHPVLS